MLKSNKHLKTQAVIKKQIHMHIRPNYKTSQAALNVQQHLNKHLYYCQMSVCSYESQYQSTVANIHQHLGKTGKLSIAKEEFQAFIITNLNFSRLLLLNLCHKAVPYKRIQKHLNSLIFTISEHLENFLAIWLVRQYIFFISRSMSVSSLTEEHIEYVLDTGIHQQTVVFVQLIQAEERQ